jgi:hypothetical protein
VMIGDHITSITELLEEFLTGKRNYMEF